MVSNQQNLNQVGIDEFLRALRSLGVKKDEISGEPLKIKYKNMAPYGAVQRHSTPVEYETEDIEKEKFAHQVISNQVTKPRKDHLCKKEKDLSTSHLDANLTFYMIIN